MKTRKEIKERIKDIDRELMENSNELDSSIFMTIEQEDDIYMDNNILRSVKKALEWTLAKK